MLAIADNVRFQNVELCLSMFIENPLQALELQTGSDSIEVKNAAFSATFNKATGSLVSLKYRGEEVSAGC